MINMASIISVFILLGLQTVHAVPETNSLIYIYTAFTRPVGLPGIHEFSAVGLLDGRPIDYYDSTTQVKVPREDWMKERLDKEYWDKGTSSRRTKQQWFKVNLDILTQRLKRNDSVNHVLQWRHGCEVDYDGDVRGAIRGMDQYSYDGDDFLSFDGVNKQWVAPMSEAIQTKRKWDGIQQLNDYTQGYLNSECVQWLDNFRGYRKKALASKPPTVYVYAKTYKQHLRLTCMATGFYPKEIFMVIKMNGRALERADGLESTQVRPNGDGTHQQKIWVLIPKSDGATYTCEVIHPATGIHVVKEWGHQVEPDVEGSSMGVILGCVIGLVVVVGVIILAVYFVRRKNSKPRSIGSDGDSDLSGPRPDDLEQKMPLKEGSTGSGDSGNGSAKTPGGSNDSLLKTQQSV